LVVPPTKAREKGAEQWALSACDIPRLTPSNEIRNLFGYARNPAPPDVYQEPCAWGIMAASTLLAFHQ
jgi:hypothetical protein